MNNPVLFWYFPVGDGTNHKTKGMWWHSWALNRHLLNTLQKGYFYNRLVCVENIVLHKLSIKVTGVACSVQIEVWSWYLFMMAIKQCNKQKQIITNKMHQSKYIRLLLWHVSAIDSSHLLGVHFTNMWSTLANDLPFTLWNVLPEDGQPQHLKHVE